MAARLGCTDPDARGLRYSYRCSGWADHGYDRLYAKRTLRQPLTLFSLLLLLLPAAIPHSDPKKDFTHYKEPATDPGSR